MSDDFMKRASREIKRTTKEAQGSVHADIQDAVKRALDEGFDSTIQDFLDFYLLNENIELRQQGRAVQLQDDLGVEAEDIVHELNATQVVNIKNDLYHAISEALLDLDLSSRLNRLEGDGEMGLSPGVEDEPL